MTSRYPSPSNDPREYRSAKANRTAALLLIGAIVLVVIVLAIAG